MNTRMVLAALGIVGFMVGCSAPDVGEEHKKAKTSKMNLDGVPESKNVEDRRNDPPGTEYPTQPPVQNDPVDTSPGSLADQAGINDIGNNNGNSGAQGGNDPSSQGGQGGQGGFDENDWGDYEGGGGGYEGGGYEGGGYEGGGYEGGGGGCDCGGGGGEY